MPQIDLGQVVGAQGPQGIQGPQGAQGIQGPAGPAATINGVNALTIEAGANIDLAQEGGTATLSVQTDSTPTADSTKPVQSGGVLAALNNKPNRNLLDNWYFMNPVNQRGVSGTISEAGYFIDRWKLISGSVTLTSAGVIINGTISQILETAVGTNITASAWTTTGIVSASYDNASKTFTITGTGQTFIAAKLEFGSQQTLAHQDEDGTWVNEIPDYSTELAKCQRYLIPLKSNSCTGFSTASTTTLYLYFPVPVSMRATPVLQGTPPGNLYPNDGNTIETFTVFSGSALVNMVTLRITGTGFTSYRQYSLNADVGFLSAEL